MFDWMMWTWQSALFFVFVFGSITFTTVWTVLKPSPGRKGFLPISTTGGDRLFLGLVGALAVLFLWMAFTDKSLAWVGALLGAVWFVGEVVFG